MSYNIEWTVEDFEDALRKGFDEDYPWYMIFLSKRGFLTRKAIIGYPELFYIGKVTKQTVSDRLLNKHEALKSILKDVDGVLIIALGCWVGGGKTRNQKEISEEEVKEIEEAMIAKFKPRLNAQGLKEYKGSRIRIESRSPDYEYWDALNWTIDYD